MNLNKVILIGRLTRDLELRHVNGNKKTGTAVTDLPLALNRKWHGSDGQKHEETTFVDVTLWGRQAEVACEFLGKGDAVLVEGRLHLDTWESDGQKRSKLKVVGERMQLMGRRQATDSDQSVPAATSVNPTIEEDIPF